MRVGYDEVSAGLIFSVDAGSEQSAFVLFDPSKQRIVDKGVLDNDALLRKIATATMSVFAFEKIASFGFPVGKEILDTAEWNGRFRHAAEMRGISIFPITRKMCVTYFTGKATSGDSELRAVMVARFPYENIGRIANGADIRSALALAAFAADHIGVKVVIATKPLHPDAGISIIHRVSATPK